MTTSALVTCPECEQGPFTLLEGRLQMHTSNGDLCPMGGHEPLEWPLPDAQPRAMTVPGPGQATGYILKANTSLPPVVDTPPDKKRKTRSDAGSRKGPRAPKGVELKGEPPKPKAKRSPPEHIVMRGDYTVFTEANGGLDAARAAMGTAIALWELASEHERGDPPILVTGRVRATEYIPARTIPATVKVVRERSKG